MGEEYRKIDDKKLILDVLLRLKTTVDFDFNDGKRRSVVEIHKNYSHKIQSAIEAADRI